MSERILVLTMFRDPDDGCRGCPFFHSNAEYAETWCTAPGHENDWGMGYYNGGPAPGWCAFRKAGEPVKQTKEDT